MIIGLTGKNASGKGAVLEFLRERSFYAFSLSDALRSELAARKLPLTRDNLIALGTELRREFGNGVLAERILEELEEEKNYIVDSFRHPVEVETFRRRGDFILLNVHADDRIRFERIASRGRENDPRKLEEFLKLEAQEAKSDNAFAQQLDATIARADYTVENNGSFEELHRSVVSIIQIAAKKQKRPDWDTYFMKIAKVVALRSNCIKRKVAAVIVKDKRIISTGYNGTPRGVKNCNEGGCPRCNSLSSQGEHLDKCLCSHAEENAITQAAYHGVSIKGAALYSTFSPCLMCTKMIINSGITEVVFDDRYSIDDTSLNLLKEAGIKVRSLRAT
ncbi:MAG: AAA family ATPase [Candidatus Omnitrophica bacterium]|nr:AAA family ATPase [Candidatus Omnitrophota bacterium]